MTKLCFPFLPPIKLSLFGSSSKPSRRRGEKLDRIIQNADHENYGLQTVQTEYIFRILVFAFTFDSHILKKNEERIFKETGLTEGNREGTGKKK